MKNHLFGVFGDRDTFDRSADGAEFDRVVEAEHATVGFRDHAHDLPGRTHAHEGDDGVCVIWGEVVPDAGADTAERPAERLLRRFGEVGRDAFAEPNGSYAAYVEHGDDAVVVTDMLRSRECYYTDAPGHRVFGTDAARVARTIDDPTPNARSIAELVHFSVVFSDRSVLEELYRIPFDGYVTPDAVGDLDRFVYEPQPLERWDPVRELADRLERAIRRRRDLPGRTGLLLSAGYDSRVILSQADVDVGYTIGGPDTDESRVASMIAAQYGVEHQALPVTDRYLDVRPEIIQYTQGVRESLHIHHRGMNDAIDCESIYHGMFFDTLFRGFYLPNRGVDVMGRTFPLRGLDPEPSPVEHLADRLGYFGVSRDMLADVTSGEDPVAAILENPLASARERATSEYNAIDLVGVAAKPTLAFRDHLGDHYVETFIAADRELVEWHLKTPPQYRNDRIFLGALNCIDSDLLRYAPPDRPHRSFQLNQVEKFIRQTLPGLSEFQTPWPDRDEVYDRRNLDAKLFPGFEEVHDLPPRLKLRMNDLTTWLEFATGEPRCTPDQLLRPN